jgi:hypothetical protein
MSTNSLWTAEDYRRADDVHQTAERIIRRVVTNTLSTAHSRFDLDELVEDKTLVDDGVAIALGEDTGCLDPDSLSAENCEILYLEKELRELVKRSL